MNTILAIALSTMTLFGLGTGHEVNFYNGLGVIDDKPYMTIYEPSWIERQFGREREIRKFYVSVEEGTLTIND